MDMFRLRAPVEHRADPGRGVLGHHAEMRRYRLQVVGVSLAFGVGAAIVLANLDVQRVLPIILGLMAFWFLVYMPRWRQKVRRRARDLPHWQLHLE